jgi:Zn-dependent peptidase ImmA (M78 family)
MALRRGFKTQANRLARDLRQELGLAPHAPLCTLTLARHLEIPVMSLADFIEELPAGVAYLRTPAGQNDFSAVTVCRGYKRLIIYNDGHSSKRQAADIAHELSHAILQHPPHRPFDANGFRHYNAELEEEANFLGPALLISEEAALHIARQNWSVEAASNHYTASEPLVRMRLNLVGVSRRVPSFTWKGRMKTTA